MLPTALCQPQSGSDAEDASRPESQHPPAGWLQDLAGLGHPPGKRSSRYVLALLLTVAAVLLRLAMAPVLPPTGFPFLTFFPAVVLAALYGGLGPGLLATGLSTAAAKLLFIPHLYSLVPATEQEVIALAFFGSVELLEVVIIQMMQDAIARARIAQAKSVSLASALQEKEATLSAVLDALPVGVTIADAQGKLIRRNDATRELWGTEPETASWQAYDQWIGWNPETGERIEADDWAMSRALLKGEVTRGELVECQRFGTQERRFFLNNAAPVRDEAGRIVGGVVAELDVTESRRAARALQEGEARLRMALESTTDSVIVLSPDWRVTLLNRHASMLTDAEQDAAAGQIVWDVFPGLRESAFGQAYLRCMAERVPVEVETFYPALGRIFSARAFPANDGGITVFFRDLTQVRQAEAALAESEARLRTIVETVPVGIVLAELPSGRIVSGNSYVESLLGHPVLPSADIDSYDEWVSYHADGTRVDGHEYPLARMVMNGEENPSIEVHYQRGDGTRAWIRIMGRPVRDAHGKLIGGVVALVDVDTERRTREALTESEMRFRGTFEQAAVGFAHVALDGRWLLVNRRLCEIVGYSEAELIARSFQEITHPDDLALDLDNIRRLLDGEIHTYTMEKRYLHRSGAPIWIELTVSLVRDAGGQPQHFISVIKDIRTRKAAQAALGESTDRFRLALEAGQMGAWSWALGTDRLEWDARQRELLGFSESDEEPTIANALAHVHPDDRAGLEAALRAARNPANGVVSYEFRVCPPGRPVRWISGYGHTVPNSDRHSLRMVGLNVDVTERREAEAVLARDRAELERLVEERTRDLEQTQTRLAHAQRMEALGQLAGGIAHDFNNVLQAVQGGAGLIERRASDPPTVRRIAHMVHEAATRGSAITRRLLAFSRRGELRAEAVDAAGLLSGIREILSHTLNSRVQVRVRLDPDLPLLFADKGQLETVLVNLGTNARDAMPAGGALTLAARLEVVDDSQHKPTNRPVSLDPGRYIRISVTDTGEGMRPDILARAAEPFFTTKVQGKGTGLGLPMAKGFAEQSGGAMAIDSEPGRGTTVTLWFPVPEEKEAQPVAIGSGGDEHRDHARARILLVDDDPMVREIAAEQLEDEGYGILQAESARAALAMLDGGDKVDLLVSDLSMPGMDGLALIQEAQARQAGLPAILLTGFATDMVELAAGGAVSKGTFSLLRKPVTAQNLRNRIETVLRQGVSGTV